MWLKRVKSASSSWRARKVEMSTPFASAIACARGSGGVPACQWPVPAESISSSRPASSAAFRNAASASGERQILPRQTNSTDGRALIRSIFQVVPRAFERFEEALAFRAFIAGLGCAELLEDLLLFLAELGRRLDHDLGDQIAAAAPLQHRHARAAAAQLLVALDAGRDLDRVDLAIEPGDFDRAAERGGGEADRHTGEQRGSFTLEHFVRLDVDKDVQIARRRALRPRLALAGQTDAGAVVDPRRDVDLERLQLVRPAFTAALLAGVLDRLARAVTGRARALDHERPLLRAHFPAPAAQVARAAAGAGLGTRAPARLARDGDFDLDGGFLAVERLVERDFEVVPQVRAAPGLLASAAAERIAENGLEDVAQIAEIGLRAAAHAVVESSVADAIVGRAFLRVLQAIIGFVDRLEPRFAFVIARIAVRMILHRKLAERGLDRRAIRPALDLEQLVKIGLDRHYPAPNQTATGAKAPVAEG